MKYGKPSGYGNVPVIERNGICYIARFEDDGRDVYGPDDTPIDPEETITSCPVTSTWDWKVGHYPRELYTPPVRQSLSEQLRRLANQ